MSLDFLANPRFPLIQAPMAGVQDTQLALAVCEAGGVGSIPAAMLTLDMLETSLITMQAKADGPWNVNFFAHTSTPPDSARENRWRDLLSPYYRQWEIDAAEIPLGAGRQPFSEAAARLIEQYRPPIVSFHFGLPDPTLLARVKATGAKILSSATTVAEARWLEEHGVDAIIAQGLEAGGHRGMFLSESLSTQLGTFALLPQIVAAVRCPVIAAGGIVSERTAQAAYALGANAIQVGTAYLTSQEATTSPLHRTALRSVSAEETALTNLFSGRPARGILNRVMRELGPLRDDIPRFPLATAAIAPLRTAAEKVGITDFTPLWCGQHPPETENENAASITKRLATAFLRDAPKTGIAH